MYLKKTCQFFYQLAVILAVSQQSFAFSKKPVTPTAYYLSTSGNDNNRGTKSSPWKTISKLNNIHLNKGDSVLFNGGETFTGSIVIDSTSGTKNQPVIVASYGNGRALIDAGNETALTINNAACIQIRNLNFKGNGRKDGNTKNGIVIFKGTDILLNNLDIEGFQKSGLLVYVSSGVRATRINAHDNGFAGISVSGEQSKMDCNNIYIGYCNAENNPGDPTNFDNHSGNGIIAGLCKNVAIEYCTATNNGWDMPRIGNGPVGIWCYEADSVIIQHCISYSNKTSPGAADGGGFDLDGGVTNSVIQYCLSYENHGSGFGLFQYAGASNWYNNTIRYCISENDGSVSAAHTGIFIWNSSRDTAQLKNCFIYNNTIYNETGAAISYEKESEHSGFYFYNNIFVAKDELTTGKQMTDIFLSNNWWSITNGFNDNGINNFENWVSKTGNEQINNKIVGVNINPAFVKPGKTNITDPLQLQFFFNYKLPPNSPLKSSGLNLHKLFGINTGVQDFNKKVALPGFIGACN
ncbi:MAG: right-handed parallel beta-helix repeat-containing protein [Panacibacter sp.]